MGATTRTDKTATANLIVSPKASKPPKMLHHAYHVAPKNAVVGDTEVGDLFAEVVTFGTWSGAAEYALPRKWDVVSGLPGVPLTELIKAAQP
jgi:hypothetical protein